MKSKNRIISTKVISRMGLKASLVAAFWLFGLFALQAQESLLQNQQSDNGKTVIQIGVENAQANTWYVLWHLSPDDTWQVKDYFIKGSASTAYFNTRADKAGEYVVYSYENAVFSPKQLPVAPEALTSVKIGLPVVF